MTGLKSYAWPGNVRELRNYVERAVVLRDTAPSQGAPAGASEPPPAEDEMPVNIDVPFRIAKDKLIGRFEQRYVSELLAWAEGNVSRAARKGEMDRMNLHRIIGRYGLKAAKSFKE
jgi:transcriptional regulator with GAF, ATPase, and Fis domain